MSARTCGFTLVELLVVAGIVAALMSMLLVGVNLVREQRAIVVTKQRMEGVLQGLAGLGQDLGVTPAYSMQANIAGLGGTLGFERQEFTDGVTPASAMPAPTSAATPWHVCFPDPGAVAPHHVGRADANPVLAVPPVATVGAGNPLVMAYPWGQPRSFQIAEPWYRGPSNLADPVAATPLTPDQAAAWAAPEAHRIHELWPERSADFLVLSLVAPDAAAVANDRQPKRPWNDAWGRPLVVAYALYQPPACRRSDTISTGTQKIFSYDHYLKEAQKGYGYNRAIYLSVAAAGPRLDAAIYPSDALPAALAPADFRALWEQTTTICMPMPADAWTDASFAHAPWQSIKTARAKMGARMALCLLSAPVELK